MRIVPFFHAKRVAFGLSLIAALALAGGCDSGGGNVGESNVAPTTPPPDKTGDAQKEARLKQFGKTGTPGKEASKPKTQ